MNFQLANGGVSAINTNLLTGGVSDWLDARGYAALALQVVGSSGISAGAIIFEGTNDKTLSPNGVALPLFETTSTAQEARFGAQTIAASTDRFFSAPITTTFIRLRVSTGFTGGTVSAVGRLDSDANIMVIPTLSVGGAAAHSSAAVGSPVQVGGVVATSIGTTESNGDAHRLTLTTNGQLLVRLGGPPEASIRYAGTLTNTTSTQAMVAGGASKKNFVTDIQYQNTNGTATVLNILDGSTVMASVHAPANMAAPAQLHFVTHLRGTNNTAVNVQCVTTGANVLVNLGGYAGA